jgi:DNA-binding response OmpR family regulator
MNTHISSPTILLIEDDQTLRELYAIAFIKAGYHIIMAENGEQGCRVALERHPNLILLDIDMPLMNGHEAAASIRQDAWGKDAKILFLTNHSDPQTVAHAAIQNPEDYIVKAETPIHEIVSHVKTLLGRA